MAEDLKRTVFLNKYALRNNANELLETEYVDMHKRLAKEFARIESKYPNSISYDTIFDLFKDFSYIIPQGSPMYGIGNTYSTSSLSNCFVIANTEDTIAGIFHIDEMLAQLIKQRAGNGVDLSHMRPRGTPVNNASKSSSGPLVFAAKYSDTTRNTAQDGRRGALMLTMLVDHPDIEEFIDSKQDLTKLTGANISVKLTDAFMNAVREDKDYVLRYKDMVEKKISASYIWKKITHNAWATAEPGVLFWDKIIRESPADGYPEFPTISTNPCGEVPLCAFDSCRLMALNLFKFVENPFTTSAKLNLIKVEEVTIIAMRLIDDMIDLEEEKIVTLINKIKQDNNPTEDRNLQLWNNILDKLLKGRRTGLGITGLGDMIAALGLSYASPDCIIVVENLIKTITLTAYRTSVQLAKERGAFPIFDWNLETSAFIKRLCEADPNLRDDMIKYGRRNIAILTIAPTGTVSIMTETTSGVEPAFSVYYKRNRKVNPGDILENKEVTIDDNGDKWVQYTVIHKPFAQWMEINNITCDINDADAMRAVFEKSPYYKSTANDVDWIAKVQMQGRIQQWIDHSISVTINVPKTTTKTKIRELYMTAWESGCKGCTVYRDGCRFGVLVSNTKKEKEKKRPQEINAEVIYFNNKKERWMAFIGLNDNRPYEIFTGPAADIYVPKKYINARIEKRDADFYFIAQTDTKKPENIEIIVSKCFNCHYWNYAKIISKLLRHMELHEVIDFIKGLRFDEEGINTWHAGVARALSKYVPNGTKARKNTCTCGEVYTYQEGCLICYNCGTSKCG